MYKLLGFAKSCRAFKDTQFLQLLPTYFLLGVTYSLVLSKVGAAEGKASLSCMWPSLCKSAAVV